LAQWDKIIPRADFSSVSAGWQRGWQVCPPSRLPAGDTADCQSALLDWGVRIPEIWLTPFGQIRAI